MAEPMIGVGPRRIGLAMVKHLMRSGYPLAATDISAEQFKRAEAAGTVEGWSTINFTRALKDMQMLSKMTDRADVGGPLSGAVRDLVTAGRKIEQTSPPDWTGTGTDLG